MANQIARARKVMREKQSRACQSCHVSICSAWFNAGCGGSWKPKGNARSLLPGFMPAAMVVPMTNHSHSLTHFLSLSSTLRLAPSVLISRHRPRTAHRALTEYLARHQCRGHIMPAGRANDHKRHQKTTRIGVRLAL